MRREEERKSTNTRKKRRKRLQQRKCDDCNRLTAPRSANVHLEGFTNRFASEIVPVGIFIVLEMSRSCVVRLVMFGRCGCVRIRSCSGCFASRVCNHSSAVIADCRRRASRMRPQQLQLQLQLQVLLILGNIRTFKYTY